MEFLSGIQISCQYVQSIVELSKYNNRPDKSYKMEPHDCVRIPPIKQVQELFLTIFWRLSSSSLLGASQAFLMPTLLKVFHRALDGRVYIGVSLRPLVGNRDETLDIFGHEGAAETKQSK